MKRLLRATAALIGIAAVQNASATTATSTIAVSATVTTVCTLNTTALNFGEVSVTGTTAGTSTINVTCTDGGTYNVGLDFGLNASGTQRYLASGTNLLSYNLYSDAADTTSWGNTVGADTVAGTGTGSAQALTVYGLIASGQTVHSGTGSATYADTITVTITY